MQLKLFKTQDADNVIGKMFSDSSLVNTLPITLSASWVLNTFDDVSAINVKTSSKVDVAVTGVLGVIFDRDALGVSNLDRRVTTNYNPKAEFYTNFYKFDAGFYNDLDENFVVFFVG